MKKRKKFIRLPEYPGGKKAFTEYISQHLRYPDDALKNNVEGTVLLEYQINENGEVSHVKVLNGLGYGCDEEAIRLIRGLHFGAVKNPGMHVISTKKTKITFRLPPRTTITYSVTKPSEDNTPVYNITLTINKNKT